MVEEIPIGSTNYSTGYGKKTFWKRTVYGHCKLSDQPFYLWYTWDPYIGSWTTTLARPTEGIRQLYE